MHVSVVICTHSQDNFDNLAEAVDSLIDQTCAAQEIIVVVDGNQKLYDRVIAAYHRQVIVKTILLAQNVGVSEARNAGILIAKGDIIAFIDDDARATREWLANLVESYETSDAIAVGGHINPVWTSGKPDFLPEELYWLVGITHDGFTGGKTGEVRNAFGPNMSFKREVFDKIGMFNKDLGFTRTNSPYIQAEEADLSLRMTQAFGKGVIYNPGAVVYHRVPAAKLKVRVLLKRSFYQGYSKARLKKLNRRAGAMNVENNYLKALILVFIPRRLKRVYRPTEFKKVSMIIASLTSVILGFVYGSIKKKTARGRVVATHL